MRRMKIVGWKTYLVAAAAILAGLFAFHNGNVSDGIKGTIFGCALISLRDTLGKLLSGIESIRKSLDNLRGAIDIYQFPKDRQD